MWWHESAISNQENWLIKTTLIKSVFSAVGVTTRQYNSPRILSAHVIRSLGKPHLECVDSSAHNAPLRLSVCAAWTFGSLSPGGISYNCDLFSRSGAVVINPGMCTCGYVCVKLEVDCFLFLFERINIWELTGSYLSVVVCILLWIFCTVYQIQLFSKSYLVSLSRSY